MTEEKKETCRYCKFSSQTGYHVEGSNFFNCTSPHINVHPNYYTESTEVTGIDGMETTYLPKFGADYGCIHFEKA